jgi:hypothetical protein
MSKTSKTSKPSKNNKDADLGDSSDVSSYDDNMTNDDISRAAKNSYVQNELYERIVKYLKLDDMIKEKQKELSAQVKILKEKKQEMEKFIIKYLDDEEEDYVKIDGEGKLTKTISTTKGAIKPDNIKQSLFDGIKQNNLIQDDNRINEFLLHILKNIEENRPRKTKTYIKRTKERKPKETSEKINKFKKNIESTINNNISDDDIPKYQ